MGKAKGLTKLGAGAGAAGAAAYGVDRAWKATGNSDSSGGSDGGGSTGGSSQSIDSGGGEQAVDGVVELVAGVPDLAVLLLLLVATAIGITYIRNQS